MKIVNFNENKGLEGGLVQSGSASEQNGIKKKYQSPSLTCYGDMRTVTLAPSPGIFESGLGAGKRGV